MDSFLSKILSNEKVFVGISIVTFLVVLLAVFSIPLPDLKSTLQNIAILNVTIAIGIGTLVSAVGANKDNLGIIKRMLLLILIGILGYFVAVIPNFTIQQQMYLLLEGIVVLNALSGTTRFFIEKYEKSDIRSNVNNKKRPKR